MFRKELGQQDSKSRDKIIQRGVGSRERTRSRVPTIHSNPPEARGGQAAEGHAPARGNARVRRAVSSGRRGESGGGLRDASGSTRAGVGRSIEGWSSGPTP